MTNDNETQAIDVAEESAPNGAELELIVENAEASKLDQGSIRLSLQDIRGLGVSSGTIVRLSVKDREVFARAMPFASSSGEPGQIHLSQDLHTALHIYPGETLLCQVAVTHKARKVAFRIKSKTPVRGLADLIKDQVAGKPVWRDAEVVIPLARGRFVVAQVASTLPISQDNEALIVGQETQVDLLQDTARAAPSSSYDELGGLDDQVSKIREMIEWPIKYADLFEELGVHAPRGVLLLGPPGCGKTLLARSVAKECRTQFFQVNGPEIASKHFGESEKQLREVFAKAQRGAPSIIFIDEIDAIAPQRDGLAGDKQVERRIVAQLLTLLDGLTDRGQVVVMAATNLPDELDHALRRPGRFDREIQFRPPSESEREDILEIHTRSMLLSDDVSLNELAKITHGFVGADLAALAREAGVAAIRRLVNTERSAHHPDICRDDFMHAMGSIVPSALRSVSQERPTVKLASVGGQAEPKEALEEAILWPLRYGEELTSSGIDTPGGVLLAGPPGVGKTMLAKAIAYEAGINFISIRGPQLLSELFGEAERAIRNVFSRARLGSPCILFFDEIDAIGRRSSGGDGGVMDRVVAQLLTEMELLGPATKVFVIAATNRASSLDPALLRPGRFDRIIELHAPDVDDRLTIVTLHTEKMVLAEDVSLEELADQTEGWSGADLSGLCKRAGVHAFRRSIHETGSVEDLTVTYDDFDLALEEVVSAAEAVRDYLGEAN